MYRIFTPSCRFLTTVGMSPRSSIWSPQFIRVVHTTDGVICSYRHLAKRPCPSTTGQDLYTTMCHSGEMSNTSTYLMSPYHTERQLSHNLMYNLIWTKPLGYQSTEEIHVCMLTVQNQRRKF